MLIGYVFSCEKKPMNPLTSFEELTDPRKPYLIRYELKSLIFTAISAVLSGFETYTEIALFASEKRDWITRFVPFPQGHSPSHDIFGDLFSSLCPTEFGRCFVAWVSEVSNIVEGDLIAIDGKTIRGSYDKYGNKAAIHMVSAWSSQNELVLGQVKTEQKSNEITAIPVLLEVLETKGAIVSIDAMGCQKNIAEKIIECEADYILALKSNQQALLDQVLGAFDSITPYSTNQTINKEHGRIETRTCTVVNDLGLIDETLKWQQLNSIIKVEAIRENLLTRKTTSQTRFYISSLNNDAQIFNQLIRKHWEIENKLHWVLDVTFNEDHSRIRSQNADENFSTIRRIALNILKLNKNKQSMNVKRKKASLSDAFREELLKI